MNQQSTQDSLVSGGGNSTSTGFATGTTCTSSGPYRSSSKYMDTIVTFAAGDVFVAGSDGRKTTWYPLTSTLSTNKDGSFTSVKVDAGTI